MAFKEIGVQRRESTLGNIKSMPPPSLDLSHFLSPSLSLSRSLSHSLLLSLSLSLLSHYLSLRPCLSLFPGPVSLGLSQRGERAGAQGVSVSIDQLDAWRKRVWGSLHICMSHCVLLSLVSGGTTNPASVPGTPEGQTGSEGDREVGTGVRLG